MRGNSALILRDVS